MPSNKVLITGAGGLLGRSVATCLSREGWDVAPLPRADLDITIETDVLSVAGSVRPNLVINCAAGTDVDQCERERDWAYKVNQEGPRNLARACNRIAADLVHISTDYVFDGEKEGFYNQEDRPNPLSVYAESKLAGEFAVVAELNRAYIVRSSWIFGTGGKNFGSRVVELARGGVRIKGVTDQVSIPTYAPDLAARIVEIVRRKAYGLYHVTNTGPTTWMQFARMALDLAGLGDNVIEPVTRAELAQPAARPRNSAMKCLLSERLGFASMRSWQDALIEFIRESGNKLEA